MTDPKTMLLALADELRHLADTDGSWPQVGVVADRLSTIAASLPEPGAQPRDGLLFDSEWVNIVSHDRCWENYSKEDAVHAAVKMTQDAIAANLARRSSNDARDATKAPTTGANEVEA